MTQYAHNTPHGAAMSSTLTSYLTHLVEGLQGQYGTVGLYAAVQRLFVGFGFVGGPGSCVIGALRSRSPRTAS